MPDLHKIEHTDSSEAIEQKREAFAAALADVAGIIKNAIITNMAYPVMEANFFPVFL